MFTGRIDETKYNAEGHNAKEIEVNYNRSIARTVTTWRTVNVLVRSRVRLVENDLYKYDLENPPRLYRAFSN